MRDPRFALRLRTMDRGPTAGRGLVAAVAALLLCIARVDAQHPALAVAPEQPLPGSIVRITLTEALVSDGPLGRVTGTMSGEPLHFFESAPGTWRAVGAVSVDASDSVQIQAVLRRPDGTADTVRWQVRLPPPPARGPPQRLAVAPRFTQPLDAATRARIERENARAREIGRRAHDTPPQWLESFIQPRDSRVTSSFGTGRSFNGQVTSRHLGVDFAGGSGTPVRAANRGIVALVDTFFLAGRVVYIDHGGGIVTGYFHLSEMAVSAGDTVERGQRIGAVGATGRVTGPHLHWSARYGTLTVNPLDLIGLGRWYGGGQGR